MRKFRYRELGEISRWGKEQACQFSPLSRIKFCKYLRPDSDCEVHFPGIHFVAVFLSGEMEYQEPGRPPIHCRRGSVLLIPSDCCYSWHITSPTNTFQIMHNGFSALEHGNFSLLFGAGRLHLLALEYPEDRLVELEKKLTRLESAPYPQARLIAVLIDFFTDLLELAGPIAPLAASARQQVISLCIVYIEEHLASTIRVSDLAKISHLSSVRIFQLFHEEFQLPPQQYIAMRRLGKARQMLESSELPAGEIAAKLGFSSANYFQRFFRIHTGKTPRAYRKSCRSGNEIA